MLYMIEYARYDANTNAVKEKGFVASKDNLELRLVPSMYTGNAIFTDNTYREQKGIVRYVRDVEVIKGMLKRAQDRFPELQFHIKKEE